MKYYKNLFSLMIIIVLSTGCSIFKSNQQEQSSPTTEPSAAASLQPTTSPTAASTPTPSPSQQADPIRERIADMTLEEKIGQMIIVGLNGTASDPSITKLIEDYHVGGAILFKRNIDSAAQTVQLLNDLKSTNEKSGHDLPLFLSVDEEGGTVSRMPKEFSKLPTNEIIGRKNDEQLSHDIGQAIGQQLRMVGFNLNFAPVLDINSNPDNPVIGNRSFGNEADLVSKLGIATMQGMQQENIRTAVKHFPGHGDTATDSHKGLPIIDHTLEQLQGNELIPFKQAVEANADMIMVAHILLPQLDPTFPSSLSPVIVTDLLREQMGYEGVIITDDMTMGAILQTRSIEEAVVQAVLAGNDIVLVCHDYTKEMSAVEALLQAAQNGTIPLQQIEDSVYRIIQLKDKLSDAPTELQANELAQWNSQMEQLIQRIQQ